ncbi:MAG: Gfo/Idh/MocA family oxidoreductase [Acidobacteriota bacterium]|nr:Gfo/Idh/MocA family oxidoreductase [Acidobacteriota bacterium]
MVKVGIIGMGFIGQQHFQTWADVEGAQVVAVADKQVEKVAAAAAAVGGNVGEAAALDLSGVQRFTDADEMLKAGGFDVVDICLPTTVHALMTKKACQAGFHAICEKPMALSIEECDEMIAAAEANDRLLFIAQCIRFWPEYEVLAGMIQKGELGRLVSMKFTRVSPSPFWSQDGWLNDSSKSGGALLDLHVHDADYIMSVMGMPKAVFSRAGHMAPDGPKVDHVMTHYIYDDVAVFAEGGWAMPPTYPFEMAYEVLGEKGCLRFSTSRDPMLSFHPAQGDPVTPEYRATSGYMQELEYFAACIENNQVPTRVTAFDAREAIRLILAEKESIETGQIVEL